MKTAVVIFVFVSVSFLTDCANATTSKVVYLMVEEGMSNGIVRTRPDGTKTFYLKENQFITNTFESETTYCNTTVKNIVYSNDGASGYVAIDMDSQSRVTYRIQKPLAAAGVTPGEQWDELRNSRRVGEAKRLGRSNSHSVKLTATHTGCSGIEIGTISLDITCTEPPTRPPTSRSSPSSDGSSTTGIAAGTSSTIALIVIVGVCVICACLTRICCGKID